MTVPVPLAKSPRGMARWLLIGLCALATPSSYVLSAGRVDAAVQQSPFIRSNPRLTAFPVMGSDGISFAQFTDRRPLDLSRSGGRVGFVWSGKARGPAAPGSVYFALDRDRDRTHNLEWYSQAAPDRVVYECDKTTPAALFTYNWGYYVPLDVRNPAVRQYLLAPMLAALRSGATIIALDNVNLRNTGRRCGIFRDGRWVQLYAGGGEDPAYAGAVLDWVGWLADQIHAHGGLLAINAKVDPDNEAATRKLIQLADIWLDEAAFTRDCKARASDRDWAVKMSVSQWAAARMPWVSLDKSCAPPAGLSDEEAAWIAGNFLLAEGPQSYLGVYHDGDQLGPLRYPSSLNPRVGDPQGAAFAVGGGGMARRFSRGLVVVNPSSAATLDYVLPAGTWRMLSGASAPATIRITPTSAAIVLAD